MNGRKIVLLILIGGAAIALLLAWWAREVGFPKHPQPQAPASDKAGLAKPAEAASKSVGAATTTSTSTSTGASAGQLSSQPKTTAEKQAMLMQAALAIQKQNGQRYSRALARWSTEKRDAAWAPAREKALHLALETDNIQITPDQLECRATLCRLALRAPTPLANAPSIRKEIGDSSAIGNENTGPSRMTIVFIPRAGQGLDG